MKGDFHVRFRENLRVKLPCQRIGNVGRRDLVHHFGGSVAEHALSADVEDLNDALGVGGDAREVGAVENRAT